MDETSFASQLRRKVNLTLEFWILKQGDDSDEEKNHNYGKHHHHRNYADDEWTVNTVRFDVPDT